MSIEFTLLDPNNKLLLDLNTKIHSNTILWKYHLKHIEFLRDYAIYIFNKLNIEVDVGKVESIALLHDIMKGRAIKSTMKPVTWSDMSIPNDNNRYVRLNLDSLKTLGLDEYFNTDIQLHALSATIFMIKELNIEDKELLYPVAFHSCPIIEVYKTLDERLRSIVDVIMLSDKLSSNYLRVNTRDLKVRVDLEQIVFGNNRNEFNYQLGLFVAKLTSRGKSKEKQSIIATDYYYQRLRDSNPFITEKYSLKKLGEAKTWPKRNAPIWREV